MRLFAPFLALLCLTAAPVRAAVHAVNNVNSMRCAYEFAQAGSGLTFDPYSATNGASRTWSVFNSPYYKAQICTLATMGAGAC